MNVAIEDIVRRLNDALCRDPVAITYLVEQPVMVTEAMVNHPAFVVRAVEKPGAPTYAIGLLGFLNGIIRDDEDTPPICIVCDDETGELLEFRWLGEEDGK